MELNDARVNQLLPIVSFQQEGLIWQWLVTQRDYPSIHKTQKLITVKSDLPGAISFCEQGEQCGH